MDRSTDETATRTAARRGAKSTSDRHAPTTTSPCVGIVRGVRDDAGPLLLVTGRTPLTAAETYGNFLTHPRGHHAAWEGWRRLGPAGLARRGLPTVIAWHERFSSCPSPGAS